jgi:hypothetical protein
MNCVFCGKDKQVTEDDFGKLCCEDCRFKRQFCYVCEVREPIIMCNCCSDVLCELHFSICSICSTIQCLNCLNITTCFGCKKHFCESCEIIQQCEECKLPYCKQCSEFISTLCIKCHLNDVDDE